MISKIPADKKRGIAAFTRIYDSRATQVEIMTLADDNGGEVVSCDDAQDYDIYRFGPGVGFVVVEFAPGNWQCETSSDGKKFKKWMLPVRSAEGYLAEHIMCIDGENLTPRRWYRWMKV